MNSERARLPYTRPTSTALALPSTAYWRMACITMLVDYVIETDEPEPGAVEAYVADAEASRGASDESFWARFDTLESCLRAFQVWTGCCEPDASRGE